MNIENYIYQLLYRYQCVTVPGLGAFISEVEAAKIDDGGVNFHPPRKLISWNSYLKNNDGLLAHHISAVENISYNSALEKVYAQVSSWQYTLQCGNQITLEGIGNLIPGAEGRVIFEPSGTTNFHTSSFGLTTFISPLVHRQEENQSDVVVEITKSTRRSSYLKYAAALITGLGIFGFVLDNHYQEKIIAESQLVRLDVQKDVEKKIQEATFFIKTPLPTVKLNVAKGSAPYHIVAGAFRNEDNAQRIFEKLVQEGYEARRLPINRYGLHPVLFGSYTSYKDAENALKMIHKGKSKEAWILIQEL